MNNSNKNNGLNFAERLGLAERRAENRDKQINKMFDSDASATCSTINTILTKRFRDTEFIVDYSTGRGQTFISNFYLTVLIASDGTAHEDQLLSILQEIVYVFAGIQFDAEPVRVDCMRETGFIAYALNFVIHYDYYHNKLFEVDY